MSFLKRRLFYVCGCVCSITLEMILPAVHIVNTYTSSTHMALNVNVNLEFNLKHSVDFS